MKTSHRLPGAVIIPGYLPEGVAEGLTDIYQLLPPMLPVYG